MNESEYTYKYVAPRRGTGTRGPKIRPERWISGPDVVEHDKYYAWLKHQAQARYRGEQHDITWEQWQQLWTTDCWLNRGRSKHCNMLVRINNQGAWTLSNVKMIVVKDKGQYYVKGLK